MACRNHYPLWRTWQQSMYQFWWTSTSIRDLYLFQIRLKKSTSLSQWWLNTIFESALKVLSFVTADKTIYDIIVYDNNDKKCNDDWHLEHDEYYFFRQNNGEQGIRRRIRMSEVPPFVKLLFWKNRNALQGGGWLFLKVIFANILLQGQAYLHHTHLPALIIHNNTLCNGNHFSVHTNYLFQV